MRISFALLLAFFFVGCDSVQVEGNEYVIWSTSTSRITVVLKHEPDEHVITWDGASRGHVRIQHESQGIEILAFDPAAAPYAPTVAAITNEKCLLMLYQAVPVDESGTLRYRISVVFVSPNATREVFAKTFEVLRPGTNGEISRVHHNFDTRFGSTLKLMEVTTRFKGIDAIVAPSVQRVILEISSNGVAQEVVGAADAVELR